MTTNKKRWNQFEVVKEVGGAPNQGTHATLKQGGPGGGANITVDREVRKPPTRKPSK